MSKITSFSLMTTAILCGSLAALAADAPAKLSCPVSGKPASKEHAADYKEGKVYFCCDNCPKAFAKNTKKFVNKANAQLVTTGQYKQVKCPLTGKALNPETALTVAGVEVQFCCGNCKGKVEEAKTNKKLAIVFNDKAFAKGFVKAEAK